MTGLDKDLGWRTEVGNVSAAADGSAVGQLQVLILTGLNGTCCPSLPPDMRTSIQDVQLWCALMPVLLLL